MTGVRWYSVEAKFSLVLLVGSVTEPLSFYGWSIHRLMATVDHFNRLLFAKHEHSLAVRLVSASESDTVTLAVQGLSSLSCVYSASPESCQRRSSSSLLLRATALTANDGRRLIDLAILALNLAEMIQSFRILLPAPLSVHTNSAIPAL